MIKRVRLKVTEPAVQNVGYRDEVERIASELLVVGSIQNLRDGSVEVICEGEEDVLRVFIERISIREKEEEKEFFPRIWVKDIVETWEQPKGEFNSFGRKYSETEEFLKDVSYELKIARNVLMKMASSLTQFTTDTNRNFHMLETRYHTISIVSFAMLISISTIAIFGSLVYSEMLPKTPFSFISIFTVNIVVWIGVIYFAFRRKTTSSEQS